MGHALVTSVFGFGVARFFLGLGESGNFPAAIKATAEWFPPKERSLATGIFNSGSSVGAILAPFVVPWVALHFGWRASFLVTGAFSATWIVWWSLKYRKPREAMDWSQVVVVAAPAGPAMAWWRLLRYRQTWGIVLGRFLLDPFWYFISEWFALYLLSRGFRLEQSMLGFWMPFLGADLGNFVGGGLSSYWISRGWSVGKARRAVLLIFGPSMICLLLALHTKSYVAALCVFAYSSFAYAACSTMFTCLPTDVFHARAVGTVSGMAGTGAGVGTMISTYLIGRVTDATSFAPVIAAAAIIPCVATAVFVTMVRASPRPDPRGLLRDFD